MGAGTLEATIIEESVDGEVFSRVKVEIKETTTQAAGGRSITGNFFLLSEEAPLSDRAIDLLSGEAKDVIMAHERAPLHPLEFDNLQNIVFGRNPVGVHTESIKELIDKAFSGGVEQRKKAADDIEACFDIMMKSVSTDHKPTVRALLREYLGKEYHGVDEDRVSYWERLIIVYGTTLPNMGPNWTRMPVTGELMGLASGGALNPENLNSYELGMARLVLSIPVPGFLKAGAEFLFIQVKWEGPEDGVGQRPNNHAEPWKFAAVAGQVGIGWSKSTKDLIPYQGSIPVSGGLKTYKFDSIIEYEPADFLGGFTISSVSAQVEVPGIISEGVGASGMTIYAESDKPPLFIDFGAGATVAAIPSAFRAKVEVGIEAKTSLGWIFSIPSVSPTEVQIAVGNHGLAEGYRNGMPRRNRRSAGDSRSRTTGTSFRSAVGSR